MNITFKSKRLQKTFSTSEMLITAFGKPTARRIMNRMSTLDALANLNDVPTTPPERRHQLSGQRREQFAVDIGSNQRLVFRPNHHPIPRKDDGGFDLELITDITILEVTDYH